MSTSRYPEHNITPVPLINFSPGQHLYGCKTIKGRQVHFLLAFNSVAKGIVNATVLSVLPPHQALMEKEKKMLSKPFKINVQACYVYGALPGSPFPRACYFKSERDSAS